MTVTLTPHLWFTEKAEEAARFYCGVIPDSRIERVTTIPADSPSGPAGSVPIVGFTLAGTPMMAIAAGPLDPFNHAISLMLECDTQDEVDHLYDALLDGGSEEECGWLRDRYGLCWQVTPRRLKVWMAAPDRAAARRVAEAMLKMRRLDIAALEAAFRG